MASLNFEELKERSLKIRQRYHELERIHHESEWTVEEDALAFLTDVGLIGRYVMSQQGDGQKRILQKNSNIKLANQSGGLPF